MTNTIHSNKGAITIAQVDTRTMRIEFKVSQREFLNRFLSVVSSLQPSDKQLTPTEITILTEFLLLPPKFDYQRFSSQARNRVITSLSTNGLKISRPNLNNRLYDLLDKGYLRRDDDRVIYVAQYIVKALQNFLSKKQLSIALEFTQTDDNKQDNSAS